MVVISIILMDDGSDYYCNQFFDIEFFRIFLVDHAWTFEAEYAKRQLQSAPNLLIRVASLTESLDDDNNYGNH